MSTLLTPDEIDLLQEQYDCFGDCDAPRIHDLARAIEAAVLAKAGKWQFPTSADRIAYGAASPSAVVEAPAEPVAPFAKLPPQPEPDRHTDFEGCHSEFAMTSYGRKCADAQRNLDAETVAKSAAYAARLREALAGMLTYFDKPRREEWLNNVGWTEACAACNAARAALAESATTGKEPIHG